MVHTHIEVDAMNFHSTTAPRIREMAGTISMEHRATLHYSDTNRAIGVDNVMAMVKSLEEVKACPSSTETSS